MYVLQYRSIHIHSTQCMVNCGLEKYKPNSEVVCIVAPLLSAAKRWAPAMVVLAAAAAMGPAHLNRTPVWCRPNRRRADEKSPCPGSDRTASAAHMRFCRDSTRSTRPARFDSLGSRPLRFRFHTYYLFNFTLRISVYRCHFESLTPIVSSFDSCRPASSRWHGWWPNTRLHPAPTRYPYRRANRWRCWTALSVRRPTPSSAWCAWVRAWSAAASAAARRRVWCRLPFWNRRPATPKRAADGPTWMWLATRITSLRIPRVPVSLVSMYIDRVVGYRFPRGFLILWSCWYAMQIFTKFTDSLRSKVYLVF